MLPSAKILAVIFFLLSKIFVPGLIIPSSTKEPKGILGFDLLFFSVSNNSSSDNLVGEDDSTSVGESILLENEADTGQPQYLISEDYIIGDGDTDKTIQNELFETLDDSVLDFSETNPFGDVGS